MIRPAGFRGAAFGTAVEGDVRHDAQARVTIAAELGIDEQWAVIHQVHGATVTCATRPGSQGDADAIITSEPGLPVTVATADCVPVIIEADTGVGVVHAGWRGVAAGVIPATLDAMARRGMVPLRAAVGPAIGPCCYEVGRDVAERFPDHAGSTTWGTASVDLPDAVSAQLGALTTWVSDACTYTDHDLHSFRRDHTEDRQIAVAWLPAA